MGRFEAAKTTTESSSLPRNYLFKEPSAHEIRSGSRSATPPFSQHIMSRPSRACKVAPDEDPPMSFLAWQARCTSMVIGAIQSLSRAIPKPSEQSLQNKAFRRFFVPQPAISPNNVAVITGGASGIGLAAAMRFARLGMNVCIADHDASRLREAGRQLSGVAQAGAANVMIKAVDVSRFEDVTELEHAVRERFGGTDVLLNNAGIQPGSQMFGPLQNWQRILGVNLWGVIHGSQVFAPGMIERGRPGLIINTGSKQGITTPPGDPAYNVSKAGVKAFTEALQHELRNAAGSRISAHLLIPGFVFTGLTSRGRSEKPAGAWTAEQTVDFMIERVEAGDFYILCPDNDVPRALDERRILWAAGDIVENRPALSRWHPDYAAAFAAFVKGA